LRFLCGRQCNALLGHRQPQYGYRLSRVNASDATPMTAKPLGPGHVGLEASLEAVRTEDATDPACALVNGFEELLAMVAPPGKDRASMAEAVSTTPLISVASRAQYGGVVVSFALPE
jgi:hypothetical protein